MIFCAYCGRSFTRKEHLERHLPTHTHVKPHMCPHCQLSFSRRDLLQRHISTYHEHKDPMQPAAGRSSASAGQTRIACVQCAVAKTGCDKQEPCGRCKDKGFSCGPRFARRATKNHHRAQHQEKAMQIARQAAQQTNATMSNGTFMQMPPPPPLPPPPLPPPRLATTPTVNPPLMDMDMGLMMVSPNDAPVKARGSPAQVSMTIDPRIPQHDSKPADPGLGSGSSSQERAQGISEGLHFGDADFGMNLDDVNFDEGVFPWEGLGFPNLERTLSSYPFPQNEDAAMPSVQDHIAELNEISSSAGSENLGSRSGSVLTRNTTMSPAAGVEPTIKPPKPPGSTRVLECEAMNVAEFAWPLAQCNPRLYSGCCPRTAVIHLECLEQMSLQENTWCALEECLEQVDSNASDLTSVEPISSQTRDKMLAMTQGFLHKALETHRSGLLGRDKQYAKFIVLPPSKILEYFLRSYVCNLSFFYSLVWNGCVDPNKMIRNNQADTLLVLLMIAQGACGIPTAEARALSTGLIETCRISLLDIIEKDIEMCADPTVQRCALLFAMLGGWSGDKWLMDIAMGQRGMYLSMLRHAGMFEFQPPMVLSLSTPQETEMKWRSWQQRETQNRLVYNWVMVDQELSLFHDTAPMLDVSELTTPLPGLDILWKLDNADKWGLSMQSICVHDANVHRQLIYHPMPSLFDLWQDFLHDNLEQRQAGLTPHQLRLLLHPLQAHLCHEKRFLSCFSETLEETRPSITVTRSSVLDRVSNIQCLLQKWYKLSTTNDESNPLCAVTSSNMVMYHLISLNALTNFPNIERLARRDDLSDNSGTPNSYWDVAIRLPSCILERHESVFHSGQVLRLVHAMPADRRPSWWSAAVYRATLVLWTVSLSYLGNPGAQQGIDSGSSLVAIDRATPKDQTLTEFRWNNNDITKPVPVLTNPIDATVAGLDKPCAILEYAIRTLEAGTSSRFSDGIRRKLIKLNERWDPEKSRAATMT